MSGIDVRDNTSGSSVTVRADADSNSEYTTHHIVRVALADDLVSGTAELTDAGEQTILSAPVTSPDSIRNYVDSAQFANAHASTDALIIIKDGDSISPDAGALAYVYVPAKTTVAVVYRSPLQGTAGNAITVQANTSSDVYVSLQGHIGK